jgi:diguanylate cyclase (GGDEF)-like protein
MAWWSRKFDRREAALTALPEALAQRERVLSALLDATADLSNARETEEIFQCICDSIVNASPHIKLVWAWFGEPDANVIVPQIYAGPAAEYARNLVIRKNALTVRGPAFRALLADRADHMSISPMSLYGPWRDAARRYGFEVAAAFPIRAPDSSQRGILIFYADDKNYFETIGVAPFQALARVAEAALNQAALRRRLQHQAETDPLTGLPNRRYMDRELARLRAIDSRHHCPFVIMLIDIDHFKTINDTYGHQVGDEVLVRLAGILRRELRGEDLVARLGGDEFLCAIPHATLAEGNALAQRLQAVAAADPFETPDGLVRWRISIGVAASGMPNEPLQKQLKTADLALYAAKAVGRSRFAEQEEAVPVG